MLKNYWGLFLLLFVTLVFPMQDADPFMYLSIGKLIFANGHIPTLDPFMFHHQNWHIQHEWFSYVLFYAAFVIGGFIAIAAMKVVLWNAIFLRVITFAKNLKGNTTFAFIFCSLLLLACVHRFVERSSLFSDLFLTLLFVSLLKNSAPQKRTLFLIPLMFLFWVNLHPAFIFGIILFSAYTVLNYRDRKVWLVLSLSILACLCNPDFITGFLYPIATVLKPEWALYRQLNFEWMPTFGHVFIHTASVKALIVILLISLGLTIPKLTIDKDSAFRIVSVLLFGYLTTTASRFVPIGAIAFIILIFDSLEKYNFRIPVRVDEIAIRFLNLTAASFAIFIFQFGYTPASGHRKFGIGPDPKTLPVEATRQLKQLPAGRIFNEYEWGSYLAWELGPSERIFIHGHIDDPKILAFDYHNMNQSKELFDQTIQQYDIRYILLDKTKLFSPSQQPIVDFMKTWEVSYQDDFSVLLSRP